MRFFRFLSVSGLLLLGLFVCYQLWPDSAAAQDPDEELLSDPVALGAWLFEGECVRCHGPYERERVGKGDDDDELEEEIEVEGCDVTWGSKYGGPLKRNEIKALVAYILAWEEQGEPPDLPELPDQPTITPIPTSTPAGGVAVTPTPTFTPDPRAEEIELIIAGNSLAHGAWLYTEHCYRCHQSYASYRQGRGMTPDQLQKRIEEGKRSTQMTPFARKFGGPLGVSEIEAIVNYIMVWEQFDAPPALPAAVLVEPTPDPAASTPVPLPEFPLVAGDPLRGADIYAQYCVDCHGPAGEGGLGPRLARRWLSVRPDLTIKSVVKQGVPGTLMSAFDQGAGGPLNGEAVDDVVTYVLNWAPATEPNRNNPDVAAAPVDSPLQGVLGLVILIAGPVGLGLYGFLRKSHSVRLKPSR
jgi:mono/diheme cytochrome c family protein